MGLAKFLGISYSICYTWHNCKLNLAVYENVGASGECLCARITGEVKRKATAATVAVNSLNAVSKFVLYIIVCGAHHIYISC